MAARTTKKDLESKIALLEKKLQKLTDSVDLQKTSPKPASVKPKGTLPKGTAPKPKGICKTSTADYKAKTPGYTPAPNRYFARQHGVVGKTTTKDWNIQKKAVTGIRQLQINTLLQNKDSILQIKPTVNSKQTVHNCTNKTQQGTMPKGFNADQNPASKPKPAETKIPTNMAQALGKHLPKLANVLVLDYKAHSPFIALHYTLFCIRQSHGNVGKGSLHSFSQIWTYVCRRHHTSYIVL